MKKATRESYGEILKEIGKNKNIYDLDADLSSSTKTEEFQKLYPNRFINMGISEQDMVGTAAGIALSGKTVFCSSFAIFLVGKTYDQIRLAIGYNNANVKLVSTHSGLSPGEDGPTHQMIEDIAIMRTMPNMRVFIPGDDISTKRIIEEVSKDEKPAYIRLSRSKTNIIYGEEEIFELGKSKVHGEGKRATIFAIGDVLERALEAQKILLNEYSIDIRVVDLYSIKPIDEDTIIKCAKDTDLLLSIENHNIFGGLGSAISEVLTTSYPKKLIRMGLEDVFGKSGKAEELLDKFGLSVENIIKKILGEIL